MKGKGVFPRGTWKWGCWGGKIEIYAYAFCKTDFHVQYF